MSSACSRAAVSGVAPVLARSWSSLGGAGRVGYRLARAGAAVGRELNRPAARCSVLALTGVVAALWLRSPRSGAAARPVSSLGASRPAPPCRIRRSASVTVRRRAHPDARHGHREPHPRLFYDRGARGASTPSCAAPGAGDRRRRPARRRRRGRAGRVPRWARRRSSTGSCPRSRRSASGSTSRSRSTPGGRVLDAACEAGAVVGNDIRASATPSYLASRRPRRDRRRDAHRLRRGPTRAALRRPGGRRHSEPARAGRGSAEAVGLVAEQIVLDAAVAHRQTPRRAGAAPRVGCAREPRLPVAALRLQQALLWRAAAREIDDRRRIAPAVAYGVANGCRIACACTTCATGGVCRKVGAVRAARARSSREAVGA